MPCDIRTPMNSPLSLCLNSYKNGLQWSGLFDFPLGFVELTVPLLPFLFFCFCKNPFVAPQILIVLFLIYLFDNIIQLISLRSLWYYGGW
jgi:hypothetical protein